MGKNKELKKLFKKLNRIEIITDNGRELVKRGNFIPMLQDNGETLKIVCVGKKEKKKIHDDYNKLLNLDLNELKKGNMNIVPILPRKTQSIKNCWQCDEDFDFNNDESVMIMDGENINAYYFCSENCCNSFINKQDEFDGDGRPKKWNGV